MGDADKIWVEMAKRIQRPVKEVLDVTTGTCDRI